MIFSSCVVRMRVIVMVHVVLPQGDPRQSVDSPVHCDVLLSPVPVILTGSGQYSSSFNTVSFSLPIVILFTPVSWSFLINSVMLCFVMLCYDMLLCAVLCYDMLFYVVLSYDMLCYVLICCAILWYVMLCSDMLLYAVLCYDMLCYVVLCYAMLCYVVLCYARRLYSSTSLHLRKYHISS